MSQDSH